MHPFVARRPPTPPPYLAVTHHRGVKPLHRIAHDVAGHGVVHALLGALRPEHTVELELLRGVERPGEDHVVASGGGSDALYAVLLGEQVVAVLVDGRSDTDHHLEDKRWEEREGGVLAGLYL